LRPYSKPAITYYLFNKKYKVANTNVAIILSFDPLVLMPTVTGLYTQNATYKIVYFLETFWDSMRLHIKTPMSTSRRTNTIFPAKG
ncbi:MAG: hypothetical protein ACK55Z_30700, partial [bacterium]